MVPALDLSFARHEKGKRRENALTPKTSVVYTLYFDKGGIIQSAGC